MNKFDGDFTTIALHYYFLQWDFSWKNPIILLTHLCPPLRSTFAVRETASLGIMEVPQSTIDSEGFKGGTRGASIMPRDAVSRTANVERTGRHKWVKYYQVYQFCLC